MQREEEKIKLSYDINLDFNNYALTMYTIIYTHIHLCL